MVAGICTTKTSWAQATVNKQFLPTFVETTDSMFATIQPNQSYLFVLTSLSNFLSFSHSLSYKAARVSSGRPCAARPPPSEARLQQLLRYPLAEPGGCASLGKTRAVVGRGGALRAPGYPLAGPGDIGSDCTRRTLLADSGVQYARSSELRHSRLHRSSGAVSTDFHSAVMLAVRAAASSLDTFCMFSTVTTQGASGAAAALAEPGLQI